MAIALHHNISEQVGSNWRDLVLSSEFLRKMVTAVSIREGMEYSALRGHIAYSLGEPKKSNVMAGAGAVIEILKIAGLLADDDGKLTAKDTTFFTTTVPTSIVHASAEGGKESAPLLVLDEKDNVQVKPSAPKTDVSIQIQIQCSASELSELAPKLRALLKELSIPEEPGNKTEGQ